MNSPHKKTGRKLDRARLAELEENLRLRNEVIRALLTRKMEWSTSAPYRVGICDRGGVGSGTVLLMKKTGKKDTLIVLVCTLEEWIKKALN